MSKSYGRYKAVGALGGSNTEFYRKRNQYVRRKNRFILSNLLKKCSIDDVTDYYSGFSLPKKDTWAEPTDGTLKIDAKWLNENELNGLYTYKGKYVKK